MRYREFGKTGWRVSEIGFGGARIGGLLAEDGGRAASLRTLEAAYDAGINFYDTADMYSQGESEILVGKAFRKMRDKVLIATKGGYCLPGQKRLIQLIKPFAKPIVRAIGLRRNAIPEALSGTVSQDFSPGHIRKAVEASLRRLQSDHIDLYQIHSPPRDELLGATLQDTLGLLARLKVEGKIREYGIALDSAEDAVHCLGLQGIASLQMPFGLMDLEALDGVLDRVAERQCGVIARGCFGAGAMKPSLSESDLRAIEPKWPRVLRIRQLAEGMQRSPLEAALQFSLAVNKIAVTILGMRTPQHLAANLQYYAAKPLSTQEKDELLNHRREDMSLESAAAHESD
ncbi:aldo/keto reductase [Bradyrhizobium erythrophlei]|uniref:Predicted oxidoreductase n=1 Tax=Bradyrhizobium erythrophlei TaxID=1437360 RepID=A0A1M7UY49_9BRAD|nr:aldo/keto reductase [Bradyrhizobium erythrophlei]SHN87862.1 Predicted oxidoreductase [Bradyrhizobium erythrophlei]